MTSSLSRVFFKSWDRAIKRVRENMTKNITGINIIIFHIINDVEVFVKSKLSLLKVVTF